MSEGGRRLGARRPGSAERTLSGASLFLFYPLSLAANALWGVLLADWPLWLRVLISVVTVTPIMACLVLPLVTRALRPWLQRRPSQSLKPAAG